MKILYHHRTSSKDGQAVHIKEMIAALRDLGHEVIVVAPAGNQHTSFGSDDNFVVMLKRYVPKFCYELMEFAYNWIAYRALAKAVKQHQPDCLYERYNLFLLAGIWIKRKHHLPMLLEVNSPIFEERERYDGLSLKRLARWSQATTWRAADFVLPVTQVMAEIIQSYGVAPEKMLVIHNGINTKEFDNVASHNSVKSALGLENKLVLGFTGFVRDWHGLDKVIDMIANDPPEAGRHLMVVGDGPARPALEKQAEALNVTNRVSFTGIIGREKIPEYVAAFDIALQPAVVAYASPLKLFEYLALGKAIVAPAQANIRELLFDEHNAILFDPNQADGMPKAIDRLCKDDALRLSVSKNASATIADKQLTWKANAERVVQLFERLRHHA
ncbi:glycosyltransferase family 4 protein [Solimicrobium silvestre]|uniref:Glycosyl transferase 4-like domain n=1 Tax=Solimicrobium silvestre TaxID=2099400 RepID=A0A2S9GTC9_9BURK|nr:glycosyltransferase family 4 protein [Solimicrobium silvestre]PRC90965.1 Glycosyl transferase 4-like domain [Solimicrobium silvestre]